MSWTVIASINNSKSPNPIALAIPAYFGLSGLPRKVSIITNTIRPPSKAGTGSIFRTTRFSDKIAAKVNKTSSFNGWDFWHYEDKKKNLISIDMIRKKMRG